jgi:hypothetical protein
VSEQQALDLAGFVDRLEAARDRLAPRFPDVDPGDLLLILKGLLRAPGSRPRMFLRKLRPGVYVV